MIYKSKRGLTYQVSQCQYFISNIVIVYKDKTIKRFANSVHYVDVEIPNTLQWIPSEDFSLKNADSLIFTFGLDSVQNAVTGLRILPKTLCFGLIILAEAIII